MEEKESVLRKIAVGVSVSIGIGVINELTKMVKNSKISSIDIGEWDNSYRNINKILYKLNNEAFSKHRLPTTNKEVYELCSDTHYFIKISEKNYIRVETYKNKSEKSFYPEIRLKLTFIGKNKFTNRQMILSDALRLTDPDRIRVQYLGRDKIISCDVIPHDFEKIVLKTDVKNRIINGLLNWKESKEWYKSHELTHKIGVFLYGRPGTGKSTVSKSISSMFGNAPILTINPSNVMNSIDGIISIRKRVEGTIIVLIEDFDMYFKSWEETGDDDSKVEQKKQKDDNQNAIFQMLDGVYSTEDTIYIATTNYKNHIDPALIRFGRFDIQEELEYFDNCDAIKAAGLLGYDEDTLNSLKLKFPIQPSLLQSKIMEYRAKNTGGRL